MTKPRRKKTLKKRLSTMKKATALEHLSPLEKLKVSALTKMYKIFPGRGRQSHIS